VYPAATVNNGRGHAYTARRELAERQQVACTPMAFRLMISCYEARAAVSALQGGGVVLKQLPKTCGVACDRIGRTDRPCRGTGRWGAPSRPWCPLWATRSGPIMAPTGGETLDQTRRLSWKNVPAAFRSWVISGAPPACPSGARISLARPATTRPFFFHQWLLDLRRRFSGWLRAPPGRHVLPPAGRITVIDCGALVDAHGAEPPR
jgi:hypothetical protein